MIISRTILLVMRNISDKFGTENQNTYIFSIMFQIFFRKLWRLWDNVKKNCTARQTTDDNMAHWHCMPNNWCYKQTLRICNTSCFSTATMVARTRLNVAFIRYIVYLASRATQQPPRPRNKQTNEQTNTVLMHTKRTPPQFCGILLMNVACSEPQRLIKLGVALNVCVAWV